MRLLPLISGLLFVVGITAAGCGGSDGGPVYAQGSAGGACYPNATCNAGLACVGGVCVTSSNDAGSDVGVTDTGTADVFNDAGQPCPGATINHPSDNETRGVNTSVPFIGNARDAKCAPSTGQNLAWDDNGTPIGTGASFNYSFTTTGTRTITLVATDGAAKYKATIKLNVN